MKHSGFLHFFKYTLTILAVLNLVLLFGFRYELPAVIKDKFSGRNPKDELYLPKEDIKEEKAPNLTMEDDTLYYDGAEALNLLSGIRVTDENNQPLELTIYATLKSTDETNTKIVLYTVRDEAGNEASAERTLVLSNYTGPSISVGQPYPEIFDVELGHILETFKEANLLNANDGYGKNITDSIQCKYEITNDSASEVKITFSIKNHFEDTATQSITVPISRTKPLIVLKQTSVTLAKSEHFDPMEYVESATNEEAQDLTSLIQMEGNVNTSEAGNYTVTYTLTDSDREPADPVVLKVTVEE